MGSYAVVEGIVDDAVDWLPYPQDYQATKAHDVARSERGEVTVMKRILNLTKEQVVWLPVAYYCDGCAFVP